LSSSSTGNCGAAFFPSVAELIKFEQFRRQRTRGDADSAAAATENLMNYIESETRQTLSPIALGQKIRERLP
jgi:hypothetical protein